MTIVNDCEEMPGVMPQAIAGISGGRTSARMAYMVRGAVLCFQNTGKEHAQTLEFLQRLEEDLDEEIVRLEFRAPARGEPPRMSTFERVDHAHLSRKGEPFLDMLECVRTYRKKVKGAGPIAPWARSRICTAYLKIRTQEKYCKSLGWEDWTEYVGLRYDEPDRVSRMREHNDQRDTDRRAPLYELEITKADVMRFWAAMPFDLGLPEYLGNCDACFLKDERDLADALVDDSVDAKFWTDIERKYAPMRRGRPSYAQVLAEAPERLRIRAALARGEEPRSRLSKKRHLLVVRQEQQPRQVWSCGCEGAERLTDEAVLSA